MQQTVGALAVHAARGYQQIENNFVALRGEDVRTVMIPDGQPLPGRLASDRPGVLRLILDQHCSALVQRPTRPLSPEAFDEAAERLTDRWYTGDAIQTTFSTNVSEYVVTRSVVYARPVFNGFQHGGIKSSGVDPVKRRSREDFGKVNVDPRLQLPPMTVGTTYGGEHLGLGFAMRIHSALHISTLNVVENNHPRDGHLVRPSRARLFRYAASQA
jgi:hypothetical protein